MHRAVHVDPVFRFEVIVSSVLDFNMRVILVSSDCSCDVDGMSARMEIGLSCGVNDRWSRVRCRA